MSNLQASEPDASVELSPYLETMKGCITITTSRMYQTSRALTSLGAPLQRRGPWRPGMWLPPHQALPPRPRAACTPLPSTVKHLQVVHGEKASMRVYVASYKHHASLPCGCRKRIHTGAPIYARIDDKLWRSIGQDGHPVAPQAGRRAHALHDILEHLKYGALFLVSSNGPAVMHIDTARACRHQFPAKQPRAE